MNIYWLKKLRKEANRKIQACFDNGYIKIIKKLEIWKNNFLNNLIKFNNEMLINAHNQLRNKKFKGN